MKIKDIIMEEAKEGTYAGARFDTATKQALHKYISENKIPNSIRPDKMHTTILYSRKPCPNYKPLGKLATPLIGTPTKFNVWKSQESQSNCLVLEYDCPELVKRHKDLMKEHGATYDFPTFQPHVTLSYDIGDLDVKKLPDIKDTVKQIKVVEEYKEDLDLNWAKTKGVRKGS